MRKIPTQIPDAVGRLLKAQNIPPPVWYLPSLAHPPIPLPPRRLKEHTSSPSTSSLPSTSSSSSSKSGTGLIPTEKFSRHAKHYRSKKMRVPQIEFAEDKIRRQFFQDFPFEALRPVSLVEGRTIAEEGVVGVEWKELKQRGEYPTVENTIAFVVNLHNYFHISVSSAYARAVDEFVQLRALHEIATFTAEQEARYYGVTYKKSAFQRFHDLESKQLQSNPTSSNPLGSSSSVSVRRRPWSMQVPDAARTKGKFTGGIDYATVWARRDEELRKEAESAESVKRATQKGN